MGEFKMNKNSAPRKRWLRVLPPIMLTCIVSYMDRVNISFSVAGGMLSSLDMTASLAGLAGGIFFVGYILLQIPAGQISSFGNGKKFIAWSLVGWFFISVLTGFVTSKYELLALRFLLGVAEGGMLPVMLSIIANWFPDHERGRANAIMILFVPIAGIITAPLSGVIISTLSWRWLYIIEGFICLPGLIYWLIAMDNRPSEAKWISKEEKNYILSEIEKEHAAHKDEPKAVSVPVSFGTIFKKNVFWILISINFFYQTGVYGYTLWLPTILKNLTHTSIGMVGLLSTIPFVGMMIGMISVSYLSDKTGKRRLFVVIPLALFAICLLLAIRFQGDVLVSYMFLVGCGVCLQAPAGVFWTIPTMVFPPEVAGGARGAINALGNLGGFCGPFLVGFLIQHYNEDAGILCLTASLLIATALAFMLPRTGQKVVRIQSEATALSNRGSV